MQPAVKERSLTKRILRAVERACDAVGLIVVAAIVVTLLTALIITRNQSQEFLSGAAASLRDFLAILKSR